MNPILPGRPPVAAPEGTTDTTTAFQTDIADSLAVESDMPNLILPADSTHRDIPPADSLLAPESTSVPPSGSEQ
ncbi:MAG: hypothetical protein IIB42_06765 [Candidatus Marinimicrobia bacterium]|nr:hypothetical protein [Candidatus Neomarinimicrobiota bacterium]